MKRNNQDWIFPLTAPKESIWLLYGANNYLEKSIKFLEKNGIKIGCIIDRRADELKNINGIPVLTEVDCREFGRDKNIIVFLLLQNAMQHDDIALRLSEYGFCRILYIPMRDKPGNKKASALRNLYNLFMLGETDSLNEVPVFDQVIYDVIDAGAILHESDHYVTSLVPNHLIYTYPFEPLQYGDIPLLDYTPYVELMKWLFGEPADLTEYLSHYGVNSCKYSNNYTNDVVLRKRRQLFDVWEKHFNYGDLFFVDSAPLVKYNENEYFNLQEGQHRSLYLMKKGMDRIPVRMSRVDYAKWQKLRRKG